MKETMHDCYRSQFSCMGHILAHKDELLKRFVEFYASNQLDRIYLLGSGTSYTACATAAPYMERILKVEVTPIIPSSFGSLFGKTPLVIAVSQSGRSTNTISAIEKLKEAGAQVVTLTDPRETPVGNAGTLSVHLAAEQESVGPRTRGYSATVFTLYLMALECGFFQGTISKECYDQEIAK